MAKPKNSIDFQELMAALRPFAKFQEHGWQDTAWEDKSWDHSVLVRYKDRKETKTVIRLEDFERALMAYRMAGGK